MRAGVFSWTPPLSEPANSNRSDAASLTWIKCRKLAWGILGAMKTTSFVLFAAALLGSGAVLAEPPAAQCPQPRFTGKAPEPDYGRINPLAADRASVAAGRAL